MSSNSLNIILFGERGVGKSSIINLMAGRPVAEVSPDADRCTMNSQEYLFMVGARKIAIWDTVGLEKPQMGVNGYYGAIVKAHDLIQALVNAGGVSLLLFCISANRITDSIRSNYHLFYEVLCNKRVPVALVITHLEREYRMEDWWTRNEARILRYGIKCTGHACVTGITNNAEKSRESRDAIALLLHTYDDRRSTMPPGPWFIQLLERLASPVSTNSSVGKDISCFLTKQCGAEDAVTLRRAALELCPTDHPDRAVFLNDLACDLRTRFQKHAQTYDLEEAIELHRAALELRPSGHRDRSSSLQELALCLSDRYDSLGEVADLEAAVTLRRAALELCPTGHPCRASSLHDLAQLLAKHFRHHPITADLKEAIALEKEALQLLAPGDPRYDVSRRCFMAYLQMKTNPQVAIVSPSAPEATHFDVNQVIRGAVSEALKTMPTRLLHTHTGVLCNRDAQRSHFMESQQYSQLLSSCSGCAPDRCIELIHTTISGYFQFVTFSHRWGAGEPLLRDVEGRSIGDMSTQGGFEKLKAFCRRAREQGYLWAWSDTCCIDKDSSAELQEAIGSMFAWYRRSALTIVYLSDVANTGSFGASEWFRRGWTLQELLAPRTILFYTQNWSLYKNLMSSNHKTDASVIEDLEKATGIEYQFLTEFSPGMDDARSRLQWASSRCTTRAEDIAYSLFGIFALHLPVLYGESAENALGRLLAEIISQSGDISVLDWVGEASRFHSCFPAHITSYQTLPLPQSPDTDAQPLRMGWRFLSSAALRKLHRSLTELPLPQFINRRLTLPSIIHRVTALLPQGVDRQAPGYKYEIRASGLRPLEITLPDELEDAATKQGALQLVRPWHSKLLSPSAGLDATNEKRLLSMLGGPFGALLLVRLPHNEYRRIASSTLIVAEPVDPRSVLRSQVTTSSIV